MKKTELILILIILIGITNSVYSQLDLNNYRYDRLYFRVINDSTISTGNCPSAGDLSVNTIESKYDPFSNKMHLKGYLIDQHDKSPIPHPYAIIYFGEISPDDEKIKLIEKFPVDSNGMFDITFKVSKGKDILFESLGYHPLLYQFNNLE